MAKSDQLRQLHKNMQLNIESKREDEQIKNIISSIIIELKTEFHVDIRFQKTLSLMEIINMLKSSFPMVSFSTPEKEKSYMSPDGGITYLVDKKGNKYPILIGEVKNQGTNNKRLLEGMPKQAQGNAVERLGKNVIGFRTYMLNESIFPFVCFGDGCDFSQGSSILDRILTIAMFGELNKDHTANEGPNGLFNRGSFYFRENYWTKKEIHDILYSVARRSIFYYFSKYGDDSFII